MYNFQLKEIISCCSAISLHEIKNIKNNVKGNNIFYAFYGLNIYVEKKFKSFFDRKKFNIEYNCYEIIVNNTINSYIKYEKESLYTIFIQEYSVLTENGIINNDFEDFIINITNDIEWIEYFIEKYPVYFKEFLKSLQFQKNFILWVLRSLEADINVLEKSFEIKISNLRDFILFNGGDHHNGMQAVAKLVFPNKSIYFKPRNLKNEKAVKAFTDHLWELGLEKSLEIPDLINYDDHGWMLEVEYKEVKKKEHIEKFYYRQGINIALFYLLNAIDLISDNIICHGSMPYFFDLECILQPYPGQKKHRIYEWHSESNRFLQNSVLKTGLLPRYSFATINYPGISNSGLSLNNELIPQMIIKHENGKFIRTIDKVGVLENYHLPSLEGKYFKASQYKKEIDHGFAEGYNFLMKYKSKIKEIAIESFGNLETRILLRATYVYSKIINESQLPVYQHNRTKRTELFHSLYNADSSIVDNKSIIRSEILQMSNRDVPFFQTPINSLDLFNGEKRLKSNYFTNTGWSEFEIRLSDLSEEDKKNQLKCIDLSFCIHESTKTNKNTCFGDNFVYLNKSNIKQRNQIIKKEIDRIFNTIRDNAFYKDNEYSYWGVVQTPMSSWEISSLKWGIFDQLDGLAFFLLNYYKLTSNKEALSMGVQILENGISQFTLYTDLYQSEKGFNKISLFNFPISTFYIAEFYLESGIKIKALTDRAILTLKTWINKNCINDIDYDIVSGSAGTILYLIKLYKRTLDRSLIVTAEILAKHIIKNSIHVQPEIICWKTPEREMEKSLIGFCHGSSGIAYALLSLYQIAPNKEYYTTAIKSLNYEDSLFDASCKEWNYCKIISANYIDKSRFHFWAYGSGSIAVSRMLILDKIKNSGKYLLDLQYAIDNIEIKGVMRNFNYSSGIMGNIDILNSYYCDFNKNEKREYLQNSVADFIQNKDPSSEWALPSLDKENKCFIDEMYGLFTGVSGIANSLISLINYEKSSKLFI